MDALDVVIVALRVALVLVLYLFLVLVMRLAARGLSTAESNAVVAPAPRRAELQLLVEEPAGSALPAGGVIAVQRPTTLGRADRAGIVVADPTVSAEHARVAWQGTAWTVADLGSTNGTFLNERPLHGEAPLAAGDVLALGNVRLRVVGP